MKLILTYNFSSEDYQGDDMGGGDFDSGKENE